MTTINLYYEARGSVRNGCGHRHRTLSAAVDCRERDLRACERLGGGAYSDRRVVAVVDGVRRELTEREREAV